MKKRLFLLPLLAFSALAFSSCGETTKPEEEKDNPSKGGGSTEVTNAITDNSGNVLVTLDNSYYKSIAGALTSSSDLKSSLNALVKSTHTNKLSYTPGCWDALKQADEDPNNTENILCFYSGVSIPKDDRDGSSSASVVWNREHLYPQSKGFKDKDAIAHNDIHHLRATEKTINGKRGNDDFNDSQLTKLCGQARANEIKGDIARALLYMTVRYDDSDLDLELSSSDSTNSKPYTGDYYLGDLTYLIKWNYEDPVSDEEKKRNDVVYSIQGNRNPFIDYNDFVAFLYPSFAKNYTDISKIEYLLS